MAQHEMGRSVSGPNSGTGVDEYDDEVQKVHSTENIDHILDNMFVQRAPYQPTTALAAARKSASPAPTNIEDTSKPLSIVSTSDNVIGTSEILATQTSAQQETIESVPAAFEINAQLSTEIATDPSAEQLSLTSDIANCAVTIEQTQLVPSTVNDVDAAVSVSVIVCALYTTCDFRPHYREQCFDIIMQNLAVTNIMRCSR